MFRSLRVRLLLAFVALVSVALGAVALVASQTTGAEFRRYVETGSLQDRRRSEALLLAYHRRVGSWEGVQPVVEQMAQISGDRIVLADEHGQIVADSERKLVGQPADRGWGRPITLAAPGGQPTGFAYINPSSKPARDPNEQFFLGAVNRSLLLAVAAAGVMAVFLTLLLSHGILAPVRALTSVARRMEKGDLSQRVQVKSGDEIGELAHAFNAMADGLARIEELRRHMVTDVAHELRTPLANMRGYLEAVRDGVLSPSPEVIDSVYEEALLLEGIVNDLQELALAEAGQLKLETQPVSLAAIVRQAVNGFQPQASAAGLTIEAFLPPDLPLVEADPQRVGQVMRNLLKNAVTYTPAGGSITVRARRAGGQVEVSVHDTGAGIAPEHLPYVFERFYRVDQSRTRRTGGAGLGLSIVRQLVEAQGGRVWVESEPGQGSTFFFTLPMPQSKIL